MSPGIEVDQISELRAKVAALETELRSQKQRELAAEARFRLLADTAPVMIWMAGTDGLCTFFNRSWLEFRGRGVEQEIGNGWIEGVHPEDRDACIETYLKHFSLREPFRMQYRLQGPAGSYHRIEDSGVPICDGEGNFSGYIGTAVDISDRKRGIFTPDPDSVRLVFSLTERERQVLVLIANGRSTKEAAAELGISYKTADSHRSRILEKLGVHETASMVRYAIRSGLIEA